MKIIKTKVIGDTITPIEQGYVIENQVNQYAIEFDFDETWNFEEKYCIFQDEFEEQTFKRAIINNQVIVPSELLNGKITIQVYGQNIDDNVITNRQPSLKYVFSILNSLPANASEEEDVPTPTQWELYIEQIETMCNDLQDQFDDLKEDCEEKCNDVIERIGEAEKDIQANTNDIKDLKDRATTDEELIQGNTNEIANIKRDYSLITETGNKLSVSIDSNYLMTITLKDKNNNILSTASVDFPIESAIVNATYNNTTKEITFTLQNGNTLVVPIGDIISGLASQQDMDTANQKIDDIEAEQLIQNTNLGRLNDISDVLPTQTNSGTSFRFKATNEVIKDFKLINNHAGTATGLQKVNIFGKNLLNIADINQSGLNGLTATYNQNNSITIGGTPTTNWSNIINVQNIILNAGTYTLSISEPVNHTVNLRYYTNPEQTQYDRIQIPVGSTKMSASLPKCYGFYLYFSNMTANVALSETLNVQLEFRSEQTSFGKFIHNSYNVNLGNIELHTNDVIQKINKKWCVNNTEIEDTTLISQLENLLNARLNEENTILVNADVNATIQITNYEKIETGEIPAYWKTEIETKKTQIRNLINNLTRQGHNIATFMVTSDDHFPVNSYVGSKLMNYISKECGVNLTLQCGDIITDQPTHDEGLNTIIDGMNQILNMSERVLITQGNHDNNCGIRYNNKLDASRIVDDNEWVIYTNSRIQKNLSNLVFDDLKMAYYYDDEMQKIRYISLNCFEGKTYTIDSNNNVTSYNLGKLTDRQLQWLQSVLASVPNGYSVITFSHLGIMPITQEHNGQTVVLPYGAMGNFTPVFINLKQFKQNGGDYIGHFAGHVHHDFLSQQDGITSVQLLNAGLHHRTADYFEGYEWVGDSPLKIKGTTNEVAFDVVVVDKTSKEVHLIRIGAGEDNSFTY